MRWASKAFRTLDPAAPRLNRRIALPTLATIDSVILDLMAVDSSRAHAAGASRKTGFTASAGVA